MNYPYIFIPCRKRLNYDYDVYFYKMEVIPDKAKVGNEVWEIKVSDFYIINKVRICTRDDKISLVHLDAIHPNANPISFSYCLPDTIIGESLESTVLYFLIENIKLYNLDSCYFNPGKDISYIKVIGGKGNLKL